MLSTVSGTGSSHAERQQSRSSLPAPFGAGNLPAPGFVKQRRRCRRAAEIVLRRHPEAFCLKRELRQHAALRLEALDHRPLALLRGGIERNGGALAAAGRKYAGDHPPARRVVKRHLDDCGGPVALFTVSCKALTEGGVGATGGPAPRTLRLAAHASHPLPRWRRRARQATGDGDDESGGVMVGVPAFVGVRDDGGGALAPHERSEAKR